jgi:predicted methyltransferase
MIRAFEMKFRISLALLVSACGAPAPAPSVPQRNSSEPIVATAPTQVVAPVPKPAEPTPEEKAKAVAAANLEKDRARFLAEQAAEVVRFTPEVRASAKVLADKSFATGHSAMLAVLAGKHRRPTSPGRDADRHPVETFDFFGLTPTMTVIELAPGEAWFTELLAPVLAKKGKLYATNTDPNGPAGERTTFYGQRFKAFLERSPEAYGKVTPVLIDPKAPSLGMEGKADMVIMMRALHGVVNAKKIDAWLGEVHKALKPKGIFAIEQHRAAEGSNPEETAKKGYLPEKWLIEKIESAGFKLLAKSEVNANPKDTKDYAEGVWTLPPTYRLGDTDREKYTAIGESDRMTLKFVKLSVDRMK